MARVLQMKPARGPSWRSACPAPADLYDGRLGDLVPPVLVVHGSDDPRTEPGELAAILAALPRAQHLVLEGAGHSPHSERDSAQKVAESIAAFVGESV